LARRPDVVRKGGGVLMVRRQAKVAVRKADVVEGECQTDVDRMMALEIVVRPIADLDAVKVAAVRKGVVRKLGAKAVVRAAEAQTVAVQKGVAPKAGDPMAWRSSRVRSGCSIGSMRTKTVR
jgi:hypothetical protein